MRIDSSGRVGIGVTPDTTSNGKSLQINRSVINDDDGGDNGFLHITQNAYYNSAWKYIENGAAEKISFSQGTIRFDYASSNSGGADASLTWSEAMRITSNGGLTVGTTSTTSGGFDSSTKIVIENGTSGGECLGLRSTSTSGTSLEMVVLRDGNNTQIGTIVGNASANTTTYGTSSDYRLKENVVDVDKPIEKLKKLKPKTYNMISDPDNKLDGFMAHELGEVIPNATHGVKDAVNEDGSIKPQQVDYGLITPLLTAALQEAVAKIETLEAKVTALEAK